MRPGDERAGREQGPSAGPRRFRAVPGRHRGGGIVAPTAGADVCVTTSHQTNSLKCPGRPGCHFGTHQRKPQIAAFFLAKAKTRPSSRVRSDPESLLDAGFVLRAPEVLGFFGLVSPAVQLPRGHSEETGPKPGPIAGLRIGAFPHPFAEGPGRNFWCLRWARPALL